MFVYMSIVVLSVLFTSYACIEELLFSSWYKALLVIPIFLGCYLVLTALFFLVIFLVSLTVNKQKPQVKTNHFLDGY